MAQRTSDEHGTNGTLDPELLARAHVGIDAFAGNAGFRYDGAGYGADAVLSKVIDAHARFTTRVLCSDAQMLLIIPKKTGMLVMGFLSRAILDMSARALRKELSAKETKMLTWLKLAFDEWTAAAEALETRPA